jgi:hypothetical protein
MEKNNTENQGAGNPDRQKTESKIDFARYGPPIPLSPPNIDWSIWTGEAPKRENRQE